MKTTTDAKPEPLRATAYHEAGHAVAFCRLFNNRMAGNVTINPDDLTRGKHEAEDAEQHELDDEAIYACAGYAALVAAGYSELEALSGCESDFEIAKLIGSTSLATSKQLAIGLMSRPENIKGVDSVANALLERQTLDPFDVEALIEIADGKATEEEYQTYLTLKAGKT